MYRPISVHASISNAKNELIGCGGKVMLIGARAEERQHGRRLVSLRELFEMTHERILVERRIEPQRPAEARFVRNGAVQRLQGRKPNGFQHGGDLVGRVR